MHGCTLNEVGVSCLHAGCVDVRTMCTSFPNMPIYPPTIRWSWLSQALHSAQCVCAGWLVSQSAV
eukprot:2729250-Pleurochrysis_carterae.AAC.2